MRASIFRLQNAKESKTFGTDIIAAIEDFDMKTATGVRMGLQLIADAMVKVVPAAVASCRGTEVEVAAIVKALGSMSNPYTFAYHVGIDLVVNGVDIFRSVLEIIMSQI